MLNVHYSLDSDKRFTRSVLKETFPELKRSQFDEIINRKERFFESYINETELNLNLFKLLKKHHYQRHHTILLTNCHSSRAIRLCNYYNLTKYFVRRFFHEDCLGNKYSLLKSLGYDLKNVVLYENEEFPSSEAIKNGVKSDKIFKIEF